MTRKQGEVSLYAGARGTKPPHKRHRVSLDAISDSVTVVALIVIRLLGWFELVEE